MKLNENPQDRIADLEGIIVENVKTFNIRRSKWEKENKSLN